MKCLIYFEDKGSFFMINEYCDNSSLNVLAKEGLSMETIIKYCYQIARAMEYMEESNYYFNPEKIIHRDLKT